MAVPNHQQVVEQVARDIGYPGRASVHEFTQAVADKLHAMDPRWGRYTNTNNNLGKDTLAFRDDDGKVYKIDIVRGAGTSSPTPAWQPHGVADGQWTWGGQTQASSGGGNVVKSPSGGSGGGTDRQATGGPGNPNNIFSAAGPSGEGIEPPPASNTIGAFFGPTELHGAPAPLPEGYSMNETVKQFGTDPNAQYPLSSVEAPGIAKPWTEAFDPMLSGDRWKSDPGYQFRMDQGADVVGSSALSKGSFLKPGQNGAGVMKDATAWAEGYGGANYDDVYGRLLREYGLAYDIYKGNQSDVYNKLAGMSGTGQTAAQSLSRSASQYGANAADYMTQGANAAAAGRVGSANARNQFYGTVGNIGTDLLLSQGRR